MKEESSNLKRNDDLELSKVCEQTKKVIAHDFDILVESSPESAFLFVYGLEDYKDFCLEYLKKDNSIILRDRVFSSFLGKTKWSVEYVKEHLDELILRKHSLSYSILKYCIAFHDEEWLKELLYHDNLEIRGYFMLELIESFCSDIQTNRFLKYYPNVLDYLVKRDADGKIVEKVSEQIVSKIAYFMLSHINDEKTFYALKEFIFANYDSNILASLLDGNKMNFLKNDYLIKDDATRFFVTSSNYKYEMYKDERFAIDENVRADFASKIEKFVKIDEKIVEHIFRCGLGDKFLRYVDTYMKKSTACNLVQDLGRGSTTRTFRVGDYVVKCSFRKWYKEECPDLYLFAKCYEKDYVRNDLGVITGALEVQKYLTRRADNIDPKYFRYFDLALDRLGYRRTDTLTKGPCGENTMLLDTYRDADCLNPEKVPVWFRQCPLVLVDRDRIYPKDKMCIKQLRSGY